MNLKLQSKSFLENFLNFFKMMLENMDGDKKKIKTNKVISLGNNITPKSN